MNGLSDPNGISLHSTNKGESLGNTCESNRADYEQEFTRLLSKFIAEALDINWIDRQIFEKLIYTKLKEFICNRDALLEQYLHTQLDTIAQVFNNEFELQNMTDEEKNKMPKDYKDTITDKGIGVNYSHATHAKLYSVIEAIKIKHNIQTRWKQQ